MSARLAFMRALAATLALAALALPGRVRADLNDPHMLIVRGLVKGANGSPAAGARVTARGALNAETTTDDRGRYTLNVPLGSAASLKRGAFTLEVRAEAANKRLALAGGAPALGIELSLAPGGTRVRVRSNTQDATTALATAYAQDGMTTAWVEADFGAALAGKGALELRVTDEVDATATRPRALPPVSTPTVTPPARESARAAAPETTARRTRANGLAASEDPRAPKPPRTKRPRVKPAPPSPAASATTAPAIATNAPGATPSPTTAQTPNMPSAAPTNATPPPTAAPAPAPSGTPAAAPNARPTNAPSASAAEASPSTKAPDASAPDTPSVAPSAPPSAVTPASPISTSPANATDPPASASSTSAVVVPGTNIPVASAPPSAPSSTHATSSPPDATAKPHAPGTIRVQTSDSIPTAPAPPAPGDRRVKAIEAFSSSAPAAILDTCACRVYGTVEIDWERPLERNFVVDLTLTGPATQSSEVELFMGSPREFRLGPLPCGDYKLAVRPHGRVRYQLRRGGSELRVHCAGFTQVPVVLVPKR